MSVGAAQNPKSSIETMSSSFRMETWKPSGIWIPFCRPSTFLQLQKVGFCSIPMIQDDSPFTPEVIEVSGIQSQQEAIKNVVKARSNHFIRRLSAAYPVQEDDIFTHVRVSTMMKVVEYCDTGTQLMLTMVNKYFSSLIATTRTEADIVCQPGWVDAVNRSPFLRTIVLRRESSPDDIRRFCRIIKNDGFPELTDLKLVYIGEENLHSILNAFQQKISRSIRLNIIPKDFTAGVTIAVYDLTHRVCYSFAEAAQESLYFVLGRLRLITDDVEGLENFFKTVDFSSFSRLQEITLSSCPLQKRGFELFIRSMWPEGASSSDVPPVRVLRLDEVQLHNTAMLSMASVMNRGLFANLEELDLSSNKISEKGIRLLADALSNFACPNLKKLLLTDNFVSVGNMVCLFSALKDGCCPLLSELEFGHTGIGQEDLEAFAEYLTTPYAENLSRLNLSNNPQVTAALPRLFEAMESGSSESMKTLLMEGVSLARKEIEGLARWLLCGKAAQLRALILRCNLLDEGAFRVLLETMIDARCPRLNALDFSSNLIGSFTEADWLPLLSKDGEEIVFEQVDFSFNPLSDNDMRLLLMFLARFSHLEKTRRMAFAGNQITAETFNFLFKAMPEDVSALSFLSIDSCSLQGVGPYFEDFLASRAASQLTALSLRDCGLTKRDVLQILDGLDKGACAMLNTLRLDGNPEIDNQFVQRILQSIGEKQSVPSLSRLEAGYTQINGEGVEMFVKFFKEHATRLQSLDLSSINISSEEKELYKQQMKEFFSGHCSFSFVS